MPSHLKQTLAESAGLMAYAEKFSQAVSPERAIEIAKEMQAIGAKYGVGVGLRPSDLALAKLASLLEGGLSISVWLVHPAATCSYLTLYQTFDSVGALGTSSANTTDTDLLRASSKGMAALASTIDALNKYMLGVAKKL